MINKEDFIQLLIEYHEQNSRIDNLIKVFPDNYDSPIIDWGFRMFDKVINNYFDKDGIEWIYYYMHDNPEKCYYQNDIKIPLETFEDLWKVIEKHRI